MSQIDGDKILTNINILLRNNNLMFFFVTQNITTLKEGSFRFHSTHDDITTYQSMDENMNVENKLMLVSMPTWLLPCR